MGATAGHPVPAVLGPHVASQLPDVVPLRVLVPRQHEHHPAQYDVIIASVVVVAVVVRVLDLRCEFIREFYLYELQEFILEFAANYMLACMCILFRVAKIFRKIFSRFFKE